MNAFSCRTLRGNETFPYISIQNHQIVFSPRWGTVNDIGFLSAASVAEEEISTACVFHSVHGHVIVPTNDTADNELVLVQEYSPGSGAKRFPAFMVDISSCKLLSECRTQKGSGWEKWSLVIAPIGFAKNIADQFVNKRDVLGEMIHVRL